MTRTLALVVPVGEGETPTSFLSRLAARNFVGLRAFSTDFKLSLQNIADGVEGPIRKMCALGGADYRDLMPNAIRRSDGGIYLRGQAISRDGIRRARVMICAKCAADDLETSELPPQVAIFGRAIWTIAAIRTCATHSLGLVEVANDLKPGECHDFARNAASAVRSIDAIGEAAPQRPPSSLERYLLARLGGASTSPWLDSMPFFAAAKTAEVVGAVAEFGRDVSLRRMTEDDRHRAGGAGFEILSNGEDGLRVLMAELNGTYVASRMGAEGPQALLGKLYTGFGAGTPEEPYRQVRAAITKFVMQTLPLGPGDEIFGKPVEHRLRHSVRTASLEFGMHPKRLRKLVVAAELAEDPSLPDRKITFDARSAQHLLARESDSLTQKEAEKFLNAPRSQTQILLTAGLIRKHKIGGTGLHEEFRRSELSEFLTALLRDAVSRQRAGIDGRDIPSAAKRANCSAAEIVRLLLSGELEWIGRKTSVAGYLSVLVDPTEIRRLTRLPELGGLTKGQAAKALRVNEAVIGGLMDRAILKSVMQVHPAKRHLVTIIPYTELTRFDFLYVTAFRLGEERGAHMKSVLAELKKLGIAPAAETEGIGATIFRRIDLRSCCRNFRLRCSR